MDEQNMKTISLSFQEAFTIGYNGVVNQGGECRDSKGHCIYIGENGKRCVASHVFAAINPSFDLKSVDLEGGASAPRVLQLMGYNVPLGLIEDEDLNLEPEHIRDFSHLLLHMQKIHDSMHYNNKEGALNYFKRRMKELADKYDLEMPE